MKLSRLSEVVEPIIAAHNLELDDLSVASSGNRRIVKIIVDAPTPGPNLDQIAQLSTDISQTLDESAVMGEQPYLLEVSSRGVSRPLTKPVHYQRNIGRLVKLQLAEFSVTGRIEAADEQQVSIEIAGDRKSVSYPSIKKAVVQVEMQR